MLCCLAEMPRSQDWMEFQNVLVDSHILLCYVVNCVVLTHFTSMKLFGNSEFLTTLHFCSYQEAMDNVKKCKNFLATLIKLASSGPQSPTMGQNVKNLVKNLLVRIYFYLFKIHILSR